MRVNAAVTEDGEAATMSGGGNTHVSRGAEYAVFHGKPGSRAGEVRPSLRGVIGGAARTAALHGKKRKHGCLRFFLPLGPRLRPGAVPPPLSR
jgi:hypothetical protein